MIRLTRAVVLAAGVSAVVGMGALTSCATKDKPAETKAPTGASSPASPSPTEKVNVGSFAPTVTARPAPTALPGNVITGR